MNIFLQIKQRIMPFVTYVCLLVHIISKKTKTKELRAHDILEAAGVIDVACPKNYKCVQITLKEYNL